MLDNSLKRRNPRVGDVVMFVWLEPDVMLGVVTEVALGYGRPVVWIDGGEPGGRWLLFADTVEVLP